MQRAFAKLRVRRRSSPRKALLQVGIALCWISFSILSAQSAVELARKAVGRGDWKAAEVHYQDVVSSGQNLGEAHYYLAQIAARQGEGAEIEKQVIFHFQQALENRPEDEIVWREYAGWLLSHSYFEDAVQAFAKLVELRPEVADYQVRLGLAQYNNRDPELALGTFRRVLSSHPDQVEAMLFGGMVLRALNELDEAEKLFRRGLAVDGSRSDLHMQLGELLLDTGRPEESLAHLVRSQDPQADYARGMALFKLDRQEEALAAFQRVIARQPDHTQAHYQLGRLYTRLGDRERVRIHFERFRELEARDREARRVRETKTIVRHP